MIVRVIASTVIDEDRMEESGWVSYIRDGFDPGKDAPADPDLLAEFAGRNCYQSWDRPNPATSKNQDYVANLLIQQHFSVLEHASVTFYIAEVSRSFLTELSRHRHLSLSVLSQRYVDESESEFVMPPQLKEADMVGKDQFSEFIGTIRNVYSVLFDTMIEEGYTKKEARQAARCILPNATETKIVVTGNMRTWRELIQKRTGVTVDAEFRLVALELLKQLKEIAPATFQDM